MKKLFENTNGNTFKLSNLTEQEEQGLYAPVTLQMDAMGALHMWQGEGVPVQTAKYGWKMDGKEADVYVQMDSDVDHILNNLNEHEKDAVEKGYHITTTNISDEYFNQD